VVSSIGCSSSLLVSPYLAPAGEGMPPQVPGSANNAANSISIPRSR
jgi:hypothetical protein